MKTTIKIAADTAEIEEALCRCRKLADELTESMKKLKDVLSDFEPEMEIEDENEDS